MKLRKKEVTLEDIYTELGHEECKDLLDKGLANLKRASVLGFVSLIRRDAYLSDKYSTRIDGVSKKNTNE